MTGRVLLLETRHPRPEHHRGAEFYPFLSGLLRSIGLKVRWWVGRAVDYPVLQGQQYLLDLEPDSLRGLLERLRVWLPDVAIVLAPLSESLDASWRSIASGTRISVARGNLSSDATVSDVLSWVLGRPHSGLDDDRLLIESCEPSFDREFLEEALAHDGRPFHRLAVRMHCSYQKWLTGNRFFSRMDCRGAWGCTFCYLPLLAKRRRPADLNREIASIVQQIEAHQAASPREAEGFDYLLDQSAPAERISWLWKALLHRELRPTRITTLLRPDQFLAQRRRLESILPRMAALGHHLQIVSMGADNLSKDENDRFNKGLDATRVIECYQVAQDLQSRWPEALSVADFSWIMFTPWSRLSDLRQNLSNMRRMGRGLVQNALGTMLQLWEGTPITRLAREEGLLTDGFSGGLALIEVSCVPPADVREIPWRFQDRAVERCHSLLIRLDPMPKAARVPPDDPLLATIREARKALPASLDSDSERLALALVEVVEALGADAPVHEVFAEVARRGGERRPTSLHDALATTPRPRATASSTAPARLMLLEFLAPDPLRQFRSEEFPFVQGFARAHGIETRWRWVLAGPEARPDSDFVIEPPADLRDRIANEVRRFRPTCVVMNEAPGPRLLEALRGAPGLTRIVSIQKDVPRYAMVEARAASEWLGLRDGPSGPLAVHAVPDYASEPIELRGQAPSGFLTVIGGAPCQYRRPIRNNPYFRGLSLAGATRKTGCSFCLGDDRLSAVLRGHAVPLAVLQIARFRETAPADRQTDRYRIAAIEVFWRMAEFFQGILELNLPPSEFHFACRCDEFLARATEIETWLPRLSEHGHSIHLWNMGVENFSPAENERFNKGLDTRQVVEAFERIESLERQWPRHFFFARDGGFSLILFTPWTTLEDLRVNAEWYRRLRVAPVFLRSRLQLRPNTPITRLAERDRLTAKTFSEPSPLDFSCQAYPDEQEVPWRFRHPEVATAYRFMLRVGLDSRIRSDDPLREALVRMRKRLGDFEDVSALEVLVEILSSDKAVRGDLELCEALENGLRKRRGLRVGPRLVDRLHRLLAPARCGGPRTLAGYQVAELREGARDGGPDDVTLTLERGAHRVEFSILGDEPGLPAAVRAGGFRVTYPPTQTIEDADRLFAVLRRVLERLRS